MFLNSERRSAPVINRRGLLRGAAGTALATSLAACNASSGSDPQPVASPGTEPQGSIKISIFGVDQNNINAFTELFKSFTAKYPKVNLQIRGIAAADWGTYFNAISTQIAGGDPPDVVQVATEGQRLFSSRNLVTPIDDYIQRDKTEMDNYFADVDANYRAQIDKYEKVDGKTYYLPGAFNTMVMWCNKAVFSKAGVDLPKDDWTWSDFENACRRLKASDSTMFPYIARNGGAGYFTGIQPWLLTNGTSVLNDDWTKSEIASDAAIEAIALQRKLIADGLAPAPGGQFDMYSMMAQGRAAMMGGGRWPIVSFKKLNMVDSLQIVPWPKKAKQGTPVGWNSYAILQASQNKEAAWALVKFIVAKDTETTFAKQGGTVVPSRLSVATSPAFLDGSPAGSNKLYEGLKYGSVLPAPNRTNELELRVTDGLQRILTGNIEVAAGCRDLESQVLATLQA